MNRVESKYLSQCFFCVKTLSFSKLVFTDQVTPNILHSDFIRFGLKNVSNGSSKIGSAPSADLETLKKRAERFGQSSSNTMKKLEADELIKKRQERFGKETAAAAGSGTEPAVKTKSKVSPNESLLVDEKIKKRAERFGTEIKAT